MFISDVDMDPAIKAQWIADLRSGKIKQTRGKLHSLDDSMCCLGVLSARAEKAGVVSKTRMLDCWKYGASLGTLDQETVEWSGIRNTSCGRLPFETREGRWVYLDFLNDTGFTFDQIADIIECFY